METEALAETRAARKLVMHRVAENLYRLEPSGGYYALLKRGDKQFRRSLQTKDRKLPKRRLAELRARVGNLTISDEARLSFADIATRWMDTTKHTLKASSVTRREACLKNLSPFFAGVTIRKVQLKRCGWTETGFVGRDALLPSRPRATPPLSQRDLHRRIGIGGAGQPAWSGAQPHRSLRL